VLEIFNPVRARVRGGLHLLVWSGDALVKVVCENLFDYFACVTILTP